MDTTYIKLRKVPAITKQELLIYIAAQNIETPLKIATQSGLSYNGFVLNTGNTKEEGVMLTLQLLNQKNELTNSVLQIAVSKIESIEIVGEKDIINILSLGRITAASAYEPAGKLELQRAFKIFADTINAAYSLNISAPQMEELPSDGIILGRILKLTKTVQQTVMDLLKEADALDSWKAKYDKILFLNSDALDVKVADATLNICFAFNDIDTPEISQKNLTDQLLSVL